MPFLADCRARLAFDLLANTWNAVILWALRHGPMRPSDLRRQIGGVSPKVLNDALRKLEHHGLISHTRYREALPRVDYALTTLGTTLLPAIEALGEWADRHADQVMSTLDSQL
jgi:DNA-binding HxlR family transcriptional regulator